MRYTFGQRIALAVVPRIAALLIRALGVTLKYEDRIAPGATQGDLLPAPTVYAFWHRSLLACAHRFQGMRIAILISRSFDGELIARTVERLGFIAIRGSSSRGGAIGLHCAITADGPKGPAMIAKPGTAQLAKLVGAPWVGTFYVLPLRAWQLKTWDNFLIPKPFSRVIVTWPQHVSPDEPAIQSALDESVRMAEAP
jgi:lysophospholipid acyltransferase (LPLAT)-like uncharacterized protein